MCIKNRKSLIVIAQTLLLLLLPPRIHKIRYTRMMFELFYFLLENFFFVTAKQQHHVDCVFIIYINVFIRTLKMFFDDELTKIKNKIKSPQQIR